MGKLKFLLIYFKLYLTFSIQMQLCEGGPTVTREVSFLGQNVSNLLTRCSTTRLTLNKESLLHTWEIEGLLNYLHFMQKFNKPFEIKTEDVSFKSEAVDGKWYFKISNTNENGESDLEVTATYAYEARQQRKMNMETHLSIVQGTQEIVLPVQKSFNPAVMQQQRFYENRVFTSSLLEYVHTFKWTNLQEALLNTLIKKNDTATSDDANGIILRFYVLAYFPSDPVSSIVSEICPDGKTAPQKQNHTNSTSKTNPGSAGSFGKMYGNPPYVKHAYSMLHDDRFVDVLVIFGRHKIPAHRIILSTSSPVFSSMLDDVVSDSERIMQELNINHQNVTFNGFEEMMRYIYTGKVDSMDHNAAEIIVAAERFSLPELKRMCENVLLQKLDAENASATYALGKIVNSSLLISKAHGFLKTKS